MHGSRGCLGSCSEPKFTVVDEPSNGLRIQGQPVRKNSMSEDFWSTSTFEIDNSATQSQSISSVSTSNNDTRGAGSTSNTSEFVNHGLLLWNQTRQQWLGNKKSQPRAQLREPTISWNATYESLLSTNKPFRRPIPLPEMIDFLVDIWEQDASSPLLNNYSFFDGLQLARKTTLKPHRRKTQIHPKHRAARIHEPKLSWDSDVFLHLT